jgi:hypothetical protein
VEASAAETSGAARDAPSNGGGTLVVVVGAGVIVMAGDADVDVPGVAQGAWVVVVDFAPIGRIIMIIIPLLTGGRHFCRIFITIPDFPPASHLLWFSLLPLPLLPFVPLSSRERAASPASSLNLTATDSDDGTTARSTRRRRAQTDEEAIFILGLLLRTGREELTKAVKGVG